MISKARPSVWRDAHYLSARLRLADIQELKASGTADPLVALTEGLKHSKQCFSIVDHEDNAQAMFGVVPHPTNPDFGYIWLLGSDALTEQPYRFLRHSGDWLKQLSEGFLIIGNAVDKRNTVHIKWLKWLGFIFSKEIKGAGEGGYPFIQFVRLSDV